MTALVSLILAGRMDELFDTAVAEGLHAGWIVPNIVLVVLLAAGVPLALPMWDLVDRQYSHDLYGWWYFPFLIGSAVAFACCLVGIVVGLALDRSHRRPRSGIRGLPFAGKTLDP